MSNVIIYDEKVKGWTSFYTYSPDLMIGTNNNLFSFKNGDLYVHNINTVDRNTFYGEYNPSKVSIMINDSPSEIKTYKTISLEGNESWDVNIISYISDTNSFFNSNLLKEDFIRKEGIWYSYIRRASQSSVIDTKSLYGIGEISDINGDIITLNVNFNPIISIGDYIVNSQLEQIGLITDVNKLNNNFTITLSSTLNINVGDFILGAKPAKIEGNNLRGYTSRIDLENNSISKVELFAVNSEIFKSNP